MTRTLSPSAERLRANLKNSLLSSGVSMSKFAFACGLHSPTALSEFIDGRSVPYKKTVKLIEEEMSRRGWLAGPKAPPEPAAGFGADHLAVEDPAEQPFDYPYKDLEKEDPKYTDKLIVNTASEALAKYPDKSSEEKKVLEEFIQLHKDMIEAPEGYYPWSYVHRSNPLNKLTHEEKLYCIRTLPLPIVNKLFPSL